MDERPQLACCQLVPEEDACETDAEQFDCETCPVQAALGALDDPNARAWRLFHQIAQRFVVDAQIGGEVFRLLTAQDDTESASELLERLAIIYDFLMPPASRQESD